MPQQFNCLVAMVIDAYVHVKINHPKISAMSLAVKMASGISSNKVDMPQQHTKQRSLQTKTVDFSLGFDPLARNSRSTIGRQWEYSFCLSLTEKSHEGMLHSYRCCAVAWSFDVPLLPRLNKGNSPKDTHMWRRLYKGKTDMILLLLVHQLVERILDVLFPQCCPSSGFWFLLWTWDPPAVEDGDYFHTNSAFSLP